MEDLQRYIEQLKSTVDDIQTTSPKSRKETHQLRDQINTVQTICQHVFTEIKSLNRTLPG